MDLIGNFTALVTPFNKNSTIDFNSLKKLCSFQLNNNADGIVALGSTAEAPTLDSYEKHKVMETITSEINTLLPIIAGINAFSLEDALNQSKARFLDGASALLVSPPPYIKPTDIGITNYFTKIADFSFIPIILYNIPSRTAINLKLDTVKKLADHPNIIGIKDAGGDITYSQNLINLNKNNFSLLSGNDNQLLPILSVGGNGIISVAGNIIPDVFHDIVFSYKNNKTEKARFKYFEYLSLINSLSLESNPIPVKWLLSRLKLIKPYYREPLTKPLTKTKSIINKEIEKHFSYYQK